jgi:hypothetical protein
MNAIVRLSSDPTRESSGGALLAVGALGVAALLMARKQRAVEPMSKDAEVARAAQRLNRSAALMSLSVLADSGVEHYRGRFFNRAMYTPLVSATLTLLANLHGTSDRRPRGHRLRHAIQVLAATAGLTGSGIHIYNVGKRPGGFSWHNFFYGAPIGAPFALLIAGLLGAAAEHVRESPQRDDRVLGVPAGKALAGLCAGGLAGTVGEVGLLHFRGAFHNPAMYLPVTMPPLAAALLVDATLAPTAGPRWFTRLWLKLTALMGFIGVGFHAYGVSRNMGGWRNWSQNVLNGPPLPAPPSFTSLALAGLAALDLLEGRRRG